jgi:hypothetical protein
MPAHSPTDVINAWNAHCASCNFGQCPNPAPSIALRVVYHGTDITVDKRKLMLLIQQEVQSADLPDPDDNDYLSALINDPAWYSLTP